MIEEFLKIEAGVTNYTPKYIKGIMESLRLDCNQMNKALLLGMVGEYLANNKEVYDEYEAKRNAYPDIPELGEYADEYKLVSKFYEREKSEGI